MKNIAFMVFLFLNVQVAAAQEWAELLEDVRFESIIAANKSILDASDSINIEQDFGNEDHPINMNKLNAQMMKIALPFLNENQVQSFFQYKKLTGDLLNTYELQAIPNWDVETIKKCIHLLKVKKNMYNTCKERSKMAAIRQFSWRSYQNYAKPSIEEAANYLGAPLEMSLKYTYKKSNFVQWGFQANKDAGEPFFQGAQKYGFDFYSAHCFFKNLGFFKAIAIGDFTVNIGQGLMQWQSYSFGNLTDITSIKRQGPLLKPYTSVAENNFERGIAFTLVKSNKEWSFFVSKKPMDANLIQDTLNSDSEFKVTSIFNSGLHRTTSEISKKGNLQTKLIGSTFSIHTTNFKVGINFQHEEFSIPLQKNKTPFNYFSFSGKRHDLIGSDYAFSFHHVHFFGEAVWSNYQAMAIVSGFIKSISKKASINAFYRNIPSSYFSLASNPNIQNNETNNAEDDKRF